MAIRTKVLVAETDLNSLSKIYLALLHRHYKAEGCDNEADLLQKLKKFKPTILLISQQLYKGIERSIRIPVVILLEPGEDATVTEVEDVRLFRKPVAMRHVMEAVEQLTI